MPGVVFLALDRSAWGGDQSQYGRASVELYAAFRQSPAVWLSRLFDVFPSKPNGLVWIGQLFVPLGLAFGSIDRALLSSVVLLQVLTLVILFAAVAGSSARGVWTALVACLVVGSAPAFVHWGHQYLVEPLQVLSVSWFIFIASRAPRWPRALVVFQLLAATALALCAKGSQPLFCLAPGLLALSSVLRPRSTEPLRVGRPALAATAVFAVLLGAVTAVWYVRNFGAVREHVRASAFGLGVRTFWGKEDTYLHTIVYWLGAVRQEFFHPFLFGLALLLGAAAVARRRAGSDRVERRLTALFVASILQIVLVVLVFASSPARVPRYLLPLLPYLAIVVAWCVERIGRTRISVAVAAAFTLQLVWAQSLEISRLFPLEQYVKSRVVLDAIVARSCAP
ncbi:MAG TPA: hypothetical protein VGR00_10690, partial [Thermoanaerobaculia bacterium]|nr:hypothetical protein [Thermoanaerobaculia bacterium]